jgi:hypothetical protein
MRKKGHQTWHYILKVMWNSTLDERENGSLNFMDEKNKHQTWHYILKVMWNSTLDQREWELKCYGWEKKAPNMTLHSKRDVKFNSWSKRMGA